MDNLTDRAALTDEEIQKATCKYPVYGHTFYVSLELKAALVAQNHQSIRVTLAEVQATVVRALADLTEFGLTKDGWDMMLFDTAENALANFARMKAEVGEG